MLERYLRFRSFAAMHASDNAGSLVLICQSKECFLSGAIRVLLFLAEFGVSCLGISVDFCLVLLLDVVRFVLEG